MPNEGNKIIKYNQGEKSIKSSFDETKNNLDYYRGEDCIIRKNIEVLLIVCAT